MSNQQWPEVLTKEQFINALEQYTVWLIDDHLGLEESDLGSPLETAGEWVNMMDAIEPCWPEEQRNRGPIFSAIIAERKAQDEEWGGREHDKNHPLVDWVGFIHKQNRRADNCVGSAYERMEFKQRMVKIAALAVAALEALD